MVKDYLTGCGLQGIVLFPLFNRSIQYSPVCTHACTVRFDMPCALNARLNQLNTDFIMVFITILFIAITFNSIYSYNFQFYL